MKYTSVKRFMLEEEDKNAIIRVHNMLSDIHNEMNDDELFFDGKVMWNVNRTHIRQAEETLLAILNIIDDNEFFIKKSVD